MCAPRELTRREAVGHVGNAEAAMAGGGEPEAEVDIVAGDYERLVEAADRGELGPLHHHAGGRHGQPVPGSLATPDRTASPRQAPSPANGCPA